MKFFFCAYEAADGEIKSGFCAADDETDARGMLIKEIGEEREILQVRYLGDFETLEECHFRVMKNMAEDVSLIEGDDE